MALALNGAARRCSDRKASRLSSKKAAPAGRGASSLWRGGARGAWRISSGELDMAHNMASKRRKVTSANGEERQA